MNSHSLLFDNLISWSIQISAIAAVGAILPMLFRIRHSKTHLTYLHFILATCVLLPLIEPWHHPILLPNGIVRNPSIGIPGITWITSIAWIIAAGILAKVFWLAGGLWQIRRYRSSAIQLFPIPESIRKARVLTRADARFGISRSLEGPATLGHLDPIVLVPESFLALSHDAQLSIACHELIHVRRNDWLITLCEEFAGALFWFSPPVWLLLSQTKLVREQLVDAEVVALTAAPEPYVHALLAMSGAPGKLRTVPAAFFLTAGHLPRRVRSLLTQGRESTRRLAVSYTLIAGLLAVSAVSVTAWFPFIGQAYAVEFSSQDHRLPPSLIARSQTVAQDKNVNVPPFFNVAVPILRNQSENVVYRAGHSVSVTAEEESTIHEVAPPPFPPPPIGFFGVAGQPGVRLIRPGSVVSADAIAQMQAELGDTALIEVTQAADGTVQRLTILRRRTPDESSIGLFRFGIGSDGVLSTDPTDPTDAAVPGDGVH